MKVSHAELDEAWVNIQRFYPTLTRAEALKKLWEFIGHPVELSSITLSSISDEVAHNIRLLTSPHHHALLAAFEINRRKNHDTQAVTGLQEPR